MFAILEINTQYQIFGMLHVLCAIVAFGPLFLYPRLQRAGETQAVAALHMKLVFPALTLMWVLGMGMAGFGKFALGEMHWLTGSIAIWVAMMAISWFLIKPSLTDTSDDAKKKMSAGIGSTHLLLVVALYLMVFQPGGIVLK
jgi:hypothetical protein